MVNPWEEIRCVDRPEYFFKILIIKKDMKGPLHYHQKRVHSYYVLEGEINVIEFMPDCGRHFRLKEGQTRTILPLVKHRVIGIKDSKVIFVSTQPEEDKVEVK